MENFTFNNKQEAVIKAPNERSIFLFGASGTGKTTAALGRLEKLLHQYPGYKILIIVPQKSLANPYRHFLFEKSSHNVSLPTITTIKRNLILPLPQILNVFLPKPLTLKLLKIPKLHNLNIRQQPMQHHKLPPNLLRQQNSVLIPQRNPLPLPNAWGLSRNQRLAFPGRLYKIG